MDRKFTIILALKRTGPTTVDSDITVRPYNRKVEGLVRRKLGGMKLLDGSVGGTFTIEVAENGLKVFNDNGVKVSQSLVDKLSEAAIEAFDLYPVYLEDVERYMAGPGLRAANRIAAAITEKPELVSDIADVGFKLVELCPNCGENHGASGSSLLGVMLVKAGSFMMSVLSGAIFEEEEEVAAKPKFSADMDSKLADNPFYDSADIKVQFVALVKRRLKLHVQEKDVDLVMDKAACEQGIARTNATLEDLRRKCEEANASYTNKLGAIALEAEGLKIFAETLRCAGIEVSTPACDEAYPATSDSTDSTGDGEEGKDMKAPADDSAGRVQSPAMAAPAVSGGDGAEDTSTDSTDDGASDDEVASTGTPVEA